MGEKNTGIMEEDNGVIQGDRRKEIGDRIIGLILFPYN